MSYYSYSSYECETCDREFTTQSGANNHMNALGHWAPVFECQTCDRDFTTENGANNHMNALGHWAPTFPCDTCTLEFTSENNANIHMNTFGHWAPRFECEACNAAFTTEQGARAHMEQSNHFRTYYCSPCSRGFQNNNNLQQHLRSRVHRPVGVECPFCRLDFVTASGVAHHLEQGKCANAKGVNRESIYKFIRSRDTTGVITKKLLTYQDETAGQMFATTNTWNGSSYECYLCHRHFHQLQHLDQHLKSPVHKQRVYHCPKKGSCGKEFVSLASLFNHLESESCGYTRFETVQQSVGGIMTGRGGQRLLGFA
ncbi:hypothetical protein BU16DRAFT_525785 [Lophium mytilinum]|uniref:C2H2-type domain-containing protein n=1 Tax=Lophium mytilinum TaxID=390894 RepID=A0A6A6QWN4_9PEZI|nr:hypothetical protein BU16DRAFT_525785 [Lophium mytilinum]